MIFHDVSHGLYLIDLKEHLDTFSDLHRHTCSHLWSRNSTKEIQSEGEIETKEIRKAKMEGTTDETE